MSWDQKPAEQDWSGVLSEHERILWQGRPGTGLIFDADSLKTSAFGVFFFGFSIFWEAGALTAASHNESALVDFFPIRGIPFMAIGFYLVFGQYLWSAYLRRNTWYSLSNQRAFIATKLLGTKSLRSYPVTAATPVEVETGATTSIWIAERMSGRNLSVRHRIGFERIADGQAVVQLIRRVQDGKA